MDTVDFGIQVLVFRVVRRLSEAVSRHPVALAHSSLALVIGCCTDTGSHSLAREADRKSSTEEFVCGIRSKANSSSHLSRSPPDWSR